MLIPVEAIQKYQNNDVYVIHECVQVGQDSQLKALCIIFVV